MNWALVLIGFALAVFTGSALASLFAAIRPAWTARRKRLVAASVLPAITAVATSRGMLFVATANPGQSEQMEDLAIAAVMTIGGGFTLLAWIGGVVGATLATRRRRG